MSEQLNYVTVEATDSQGGQSTCKLVADPKNVASYIVRNAPASSKIIRDFYSFPVILYELEGTKIITSNLLMEYLPNLLGAINSLCVLDPAGLPEVRYAPVEDTDAK